MTDGGAGPVGRLRLLITLCLTGWGLSACGDETARAYGAADHVWALAELDGQAFTDRATLTFAPSGRIAGQAPCNSFSAVMSAPYPWFDASGIIATKRACPALAAEAAYLTALAEMTQVEVSGAVLILRNEVGREMVFRSSG